MNDEYRPDAKSLMGKSGDENFEPVQLYKAFSALLDSSLAQTVSLVYLPQERKSSVLPGVKG